MYQRQTTQTVRSALDNQAAVVLLGPRQVGKTTLALEIAEQRPSVYLDLERDADRQVLAEPDLYLDEQVGKLVILDEVQQMPDLFKNLRLRRSEIVSLDHGKDDTPDSGGWVEMLEDGILLTLRGKTGWREVEIARGSSDQTCPVHALSQWLHYARIDFGPLFVAVSRNGLKATGERLSDKHVARLIKSCAREAGLRPDFPEAERVRLFSGHSLRAGLASSAEVDERYVQKQLGHASAEMTRRYQRRRDRFRVNLTKAAGL